MAKSAELRRTLRRLHSSGRSWQEVGEIIGKTKGWTWLVAYGHINLDDETAEQLMGDLPRHLWQTTEDLEKKILHEIKTNHVGLRNAIKIPLLARIVICSERKARAAISNLRDKGHPICTSIGDPPGAFWPDTDTEFWTFIQRAFRPRWRSMKRTEDAMIEGYARWKRGEPIEVELQPELISQQQAAG